MTELPPLDAQAARYLAELGGFERGLKAMMEGLAAGQHPYIAARGVGAVIMSLGAGAPPAMRSVEDVMIDSPGGRVGLRLYRPDIGKDDPLPVLLLVHGGGWVTGSLASHDVAARHMAVLTGALVISVDYRLAPEHPFPAAFDDVVAAFHWAAAEAGAHGGDPQRVAAIGDSAGANLIAAATLALSGSSGPRLSAQVLVYPVLDPGLDWPSFQRDWTGMPLTALTMGWFWEQYCPDPGLRADPRLSPLRADSLAGLPPTLLVAAGHDPLVDEGAAFHQRLLAEGVSAERILYDRQFHGFFFAAGVIEDAGKAMAQAADFITRHWADHRP